jgi:hypothetical protein
MFSYATPASHCQIFLGSSSKDYEPLTSHYTTKALSFPPHTHFKLNTVCTEGELGKVNWFVDVMKLVKGIKNKTAPQ